MTQRHTYFATLFGLLALALSPRPAAAQVGTCGVQATGVPFARLDGRAEMLAEPILVCNYSSGSAFAVNATITLTLSAPATSRILNSGNNASEALLLVNDPAPGTQVGQPAGQVVPGANVIQGVRTSGNTIAWSNVPMVPSGTVGQAFTRSFRLVNLKGDARQSSLAGQLSITGTLTTSVGIPITNPTFLLATINQNAPGYDVRTPNDSGPGSIVIDGCLGNKTPVAGSTPRDFNIKFTETSAGEFRKRADATSAGNPGAVGNQDIPGQSTQSETGFYNGFLPPANGMNQAGLATSGTRLLVRFTGIPTGTQILVTVVQTVEGTSPGVTARLISTDATGSGPYNEYPATTGGYAQLVPSEGTATAVWEITGANVNAQESISIGVIVSVPANQQAGAQVSVSGNLAPQGDPASPATGRPLFTGLQPSKLAADIRACGAGGGGSLTILTTCPLPNATVSVTYGQQLNATGGQPPYTWSITSGVLPPGLVLSTGGVLSGVPVSTGQFSFTLRAADSTSTFVTKPCSLSVGASTSGVLITSLSPPGALVNSAAFTLTVNGAGFAPGSIVVWNFSTSAALDLPTTFVSATQVTTIVPANLLTLAVEIPIAVKVPNLTALNFSNVVNFNISSTLTLVTSCPLPSGTIGTPYNQQLGARGGFPPYEWSTGTGSLPAGLTLSLSGVINGTPSEAGLFSFPIRVTDARSNTASADCSLTIQGPFQVSPASLSFSGLAGGAPLESQDVSITSAAPGLAVTAAAESAGNWLRVSLTNTRTPMLARVSVDSSLLAAGRYTGTVRFSADGSSTRLLTIPVTLELRPAGAPRLSVGPGGVSFPVARGATRPLSRVVRVANAGGGILPYAVEVVSASGGNWLTVSPARGSVSPSTPAGVLLRASPAGLGAGTYVTVLRFTNTSDPREQSEVRATLTISTSPESVQLSQSGFAFFAAPDGPAPAARRFDVLSTGANPLFWEARTSTETGADWLSAAPNADTSMPASPTGAEVRVSGAGLAAGLYSGEVRVSAPGADNSPRLMTVLLNVLAAGENPPPEVSPGGLVFIAEPGGASPAPQTIRIRNAGRTATPADFDVAGDSRVWRVSSSAARNLGPGESRDLFVAPDVTGLARGVYRASVAIQLGNSRQVQLAEATLIIAPGRVQAPAAKSERLPADGCVADQLVAVSFGQPSGFVAPAGAGLPLRVRVLDTCKEPLTLGTVSALVRGAGSPIALTHVRDGEWSGTLALPATAGPLTVEVAAESEDGALRGGALLSGSSTSAAGLPVVSEGGIVSTATFVGGAPTSPRGLVAIFGSKLADGSSNVFPPASGRLGTTRVTVGSRPMPLFFAADLGSYSQINGVVPAELLPNINAQAVVARGTLLSLPVDLVVGPASPGVFTTNQSGRGQGAIIDAIAAGMGSVILADPNNPIARGGVISIYCEGLGAVNRGVLTGELSPSSPLAETTAPAAVMIGGRPARVLFSGLAPGFVGLYQVNAIVPADAPTGFAVPVTVTIAGQTSPEVTIAVR